MSRQEISFFQYLKTPPFLNGLAILPRDKLDRHFASNNVCVPNIVKIDARVQSLLRSHARKPFSLSLSKGISLAY